MVSLTSVSGCFPGVRYSLILYEFSFVLRQLSSTFLRFFALTHHFLESEGPQEEVQENGDGGEEMRVLEVVKSHRDPLGGGLIKDPIRSKVGVERYLFTTLRTNVTSVR